MSRLITAIATLCLSFAASGPSWAESTTGEGTVLGPEFVGRMVANLDRSVEFYKAIGFGQDPAVDSAWRKDAVAERLYGTKGFQTRLARMYFANAASGQRFVVYLREFKGIPRKDVSNHTPWDPGVTHFGLVVADADEVWNGLRDKGMLKARSWDAKLIAPPGQTKGMLAYMTDPDGLDIELIDQRPAQPAKNGEPPRPALLPAVTHAGLVVLDADKARAFYGTLFGGQLRSPESPWLQGDFYDSAVGGHGNILRFFNETYPQSVGPGPTAYFEMVEFQNRKQPVQPSRITDIGVGYVGFHVRNLDAFLKRALAAGARQVSDGGAVTLLDGTRVVLIRDPDTGMFVALFETKTEP